MKHISKLLLVTATIILVISLNSIAAELELKQEEKEPTYKETADFLMTSKFPDFGGKITFDSFDDCIMKTTREETVNTRVYGAYVKNTADLRNVSIEAICETSSSYIEITNYKECSSVTTEEKGNVRNSCSMSIYKENCNDIKRISKALNHLQKLCRPVEKPSPF